MDFIRVSSTVHISTELTLIIKHLVLKFLRAWRLSFSEVVGTLEKLIKGRINIVMMAMTLVSTSMLIGNLVYRESEVQVL